MKDKAHGRQHGRDLFEVGNPLLVLEAWTCPHGRHQVDDVKGFFRPFLTDYIEVLQRLIVLMFEIMNDIVDPVCTRLSWEREPNE